ncbi:soluble quino protein glucose dehydrogenase [Zopfia rhizophila CBS 207.26]|uniref:Soluble quino protein glucose dehydrogenase n=1 Tax=Zopfia rhizophila CBS 207.26 TaxID=1314779 RepID=A0A6A6E974_9PEZI|nr:soluble quino protein glucose dehydrogenase [Zopfia rhizophila CBS 207.26]
MLVMAIAALMSQVLAQGCATIEPKHPAVFASGYSGRVVINNLKHPRHMVFDTAGNLLVAEQDAGGIRWIKLKDNGGTDVCVAETKTMISDRSLNHGIALSLDGKTLFTSNLGNAYAYAYDATNGTVGPRQTIVTGMRNAALHLTRSLYVSKKVPGLLLVQRGSDGNVDPAAGQIETARSQIRIFNISQIMQAPVEFSNGEVLGWGLRNSVGFTEHPVTGGVWSVDNGLDEIQRDGKDIHEDNPAEEMNYHGTLADTSAPERGKNFGYPDCFPAWDPSTVPNNTNIKVGTQFLMGPLNGTRTDAVCADRIPPKLVFPSHITPLDLKFKEDGSAAYIAFHGSSGRTIPDGYCLSKVLFDPATGQPKEAPTSKTAEIRVVTNVNTTICGYETCFRPSGLTWDSKKRLFMTSDYTGEIWVIDGA